MITPKISTFTRFVSILGGAVMLIGVAQAASVADQTAVKAGMSQDEVQRALGKPVKVEHYSLSDTATWIYRSGDYFAQPGDKVLDVEFGADGKVKSTSQRVLRDPANLD